MRCFSDARDDPEIGVVVLTGMIRKLAMYFKHRTLSRGIVYPFSTFNRLRSVWMICSDQVYSGVQVREIWPFAVAETRA